MIQVNLLPDIKQEYIRLKYLRGFTSIIVFLIVVVCVIWSSFFIWYTAFYLPSEIESNNKMIADGIFQIDCVEDEASNKCVNPDSSIDPIKVLTLRQNLSSILDLEKSKNSPQRLFQGPNYLRALIPTNGQQALGEIKGYTFTFVFDEEGSEHTAPSNKISYSLTIESESDDYEKIIAHIQYIGFKGQNCTTFDPQNRHKRAYPVKVNQVSARSSLGDDSNRVSFTIEGIIDPDLFNHSGKDAVKSDVLATSQFILEGSTGDFSQVVKDDPSFNCKDSNEDGFDYGRIKQVAKITPNTSNSVEMEGGYV